jgi:hypothetical protein
MHHFFWQIKVDLESRYDFNTVFGFVEKNGIYLQTNDSVISNYIQLIPMKGLYSLAYLKKKICSKYIEEMFNLRRMASDDSRVSVPYVKPLEGHMKDAFSSGLAMEFPMRDLQSNEVKFIKFNDTKVKTFKSIFDLNYDIVKNNKSVVFAPVCRTRSTDADFITFIPELNSVVGLKFIRDSDYNAIFDEMREFQKAFKGGPHRMAFVTSRNSIFYDLSKRKVPITEREKKSPAKIKKRDKLNETHQDVIGIDR